MSERARLRSFLPIALVAYGWLGAHALVGGEAQILPAGAPRQDQPLVIIMDSPHPARVYDEQTLAANGTNADVVSDILLDLPIRRLPEPIGPDWSRDEEMVALQPQMIVIHYSGFRQEDGSGPRERLRLLISHFADSETQFLVYSRAREPDLRERVDQLLGELESAHAGLIARVSVFGLNDYGPPSWLSPLTADPLRLRVREILGL